MYTGTCSKYGFHNPMFLAKQAWYIARESHFSFLKPYNKYVAISPLEYFFRIPNLLPCVYCTRTMPVERKCVLCHLYVTGRQWLFTSQCPSCESEDSLQTLARYQRFLEIMSKNKTPENHKKVMTKFRDKKQNDGASEKDKKREKWGWWTKVEAGDAAKKTYHVDGAVCLQTVSNTIQASSRGHSWVHFLLCTLHTSPCIYVSPEWTYAISSKYS